MRRRLVLVAVVVLALVLAGCGATASFGANAPSDNQPTSLSVTRSPGLNHDPVFKGDSTNAAAVQSLFANIKALPRTGNWAGNCPLDDGVTYTLTFTRDEAIILTASADATGCRGLTLGANDTRWTNDAFWSLLAQTVGIPAADIHPVP